jgi:hypothetical protein
MNRLRKHFVPVVGLAILAILLTVSLPRSLKAIAATLVQVVNTTANPAIAQETSRQASQLVSLIAVAGPDQGNVGFGQIDATGAITANPYSTPPSQYLVITSVDVGFGGVIDGGSIEISSVNALHPQLSLFTPPGTLSHTQIYPSGVPIAPASQLQVFVFATSSGHFVGATVYVHGYLTAN